MREHTPTANLTELRPLFELTQCVGSDPLLTQASTGNSSAKVDSTLWIKASGKCMADALRQDIFMPLDLHGVVAQCLARDVDPIERYPNASLETAMHAALPHRVSPSRALCEHDRVGGPDRCAGSTATTARRITLALARLRRFGFAAGPGA